MVEPISVRSLRIAGATSLEIDFSTGQTLAMDLPPRFGLGANPTFVDDLNCVLQAALALGSGPRAVVENIKNSPIRSFDGKTALEMIEAGRTDDVIAYLESLSAGWVG
jgi:hypothetical protein